MNSSLWSGTVFYHIMMSLMRSVGATSNWVKPMSTKIIMAIVFMGTLTVTVISLVLIKYTIR